MGPISSSYPRPRSRPPTTIPPPRPLHLLPNLSYTYPSGLHPVMGTANRTVGRSLSGSWLGSEGPPSSWPLLQQVRRLFSFNLRDELVDLYSCFIKNCVLMDKLPLKYAIPMQLPFISNGEEDGPQMTTRAPRQSLLPWSRRMRGVTDAV